MIEADNSRRGYVRRSEISEGTTASRPLTAESVASFYGGISECLASLGITVKINLKPQEVVAATPFDRDFANCSYDAEYAHRFWRILISTAKVMEQFRAKFIGKCSPEIGSAS